MTAERLAATFTDYLRASRTDGHALSTLPPGRFLLPGDLEGSPALTFAPLPPPDGHIPPTSLYAMLERRFEAYKDVVVRPFFRDHFARLDRQVVLVDTLRALNAGPAAVADLETALTEILSCFRQGDSNPFTAALVARASTASCSPRPRPTTSTRPRTTGSRRCSTGSSPTPRAAPNSPAPRRARWPSPRSAPRARARSTDGGETLPAVVGTPMAGEVLDGTTYDGKTEIALFPGDLPDDPDAVFDEGRPVGAQLPPLHAARKARAQRRRAIPCCRTSASTARSIS